MQSLKYTSQLQGDSYDQSYKNMYMYVFINTCMLVFSNKIVILITLAVTAVSKHHQFILLFIFLLSQKIYSIYLKQSPTKRSLILIFGI